MTVNSLFVSSLFVSDGVRLRRSVAFVIVSCLLSMNYALRAEELMVEPDRVMAKSAAGVIDEELFAVFGTHRVPGRYNTDGTETQIWTRAYKLQPPPDPAITRRARSIPNQATNAPKPPKAGIPGPTFVFRPDDFLRIRLHNFMNRSDNPWLNDLQNDSSLANTTTATDELPDSSAHEVNIPHGFNETNLHVHGLHVDPKQDNVTVLILPQDGDPSGLSSDQQVLVQNINHWWQRRYQYKIPSDHLPGTHWYHSHRHGSTSIQVENGMAGALVIQPKDPKNDIVPGLCETNHDRVLVVQEITNFGTLGSNGKGDGSGRSRITTDVSATIMTVNGEYAATIELPQGQVERWRFVIAGANHQQQSNIWVGKLNFGPIPDALQTELQAIKTKEDYLPYSSGDKLFSKQFTSISVPADSKFDGSVNMVAVDGVTLSRAVPISRTSPTFGSSGNRNDLLIQSNNQAKVGSLYFVFKNYPTSAPPMQGFQHAYPGLFAGVAGKWRYLALAQGKAVHPNDSTKKVAAVKVKNPNIFKNIDVDPFNLGADFNGFTVPWANSVTADGVNTNDSFKKDTNLAPLIFGQKPATTKDPIGVKYSRPHKPDVNADPNGIIGVDQKWQPLGGSGGGVTEDYLAVVEIVKPEAGGLKYDETNLNQRLNQLSPTGSPKLTKLTRTNLMRQQKTAIPAYVAPFTRPVDFQRTVVFDHAATTFNYADKTTGRVSSIHQFWIDGRQFHSADYVGNPAATKSIQKPLVNDMAHMGNFNPTNKKWTNQIHPLNALGEIGRTDPQNPSKPITRQEILNTNAGYYRPIELKKAGTENAYYSYNYGTGKLPDYKDVTGFPDSRKPEATTAEEWLLVNNSDIYHPFHIHISPFFVEEVGQLNYDKDAQEPWSIRKMIWDQKNESVIWEGVPKENWTFGWVVGNWWDTILIPPHGYVRFKTWINIPDQKPAKLYAPRFAKDDREPDEWMVTDNSNVFGSWVLHCHILRHEDRGMMSMVAVGPRHRSLGSGNDKPAIWNDGKQKLQIWDDHGTVRAYTPDSNVSARWKKPYAYKGFFNEGLGNPFQTEPWIGAMNFDPRGSGTNVPFCAAFKGPNQTPFQIVFANGESWMRGIDEPPTGESDPADKPLDGVWVDDLENKVEITSAPGANPGDPVSLILKPDTDVWWKSATGTWNSGTEIPTGAANGNQGSVIFRDDGGDKELNQRSSLCVARDRNTLILGNGIRWRRH